MTGRQLRFIQRTGEGTTMVIDREARRRYDRVVREMLDDEDRDVTVVPYGLLVRGKLFALLDEGSLVVQLSPERAADLMARDIVSDATGPGRADHTWVRVDDTELWSELAREAHQFVGEPPVGGES